MSIKDFVIERARKISASIDKYTKNVQGYMFCAGLDGRIIPVYFPDNSDFVKNDDANVPGTAHAAKVHGDVAYLPVVPGVNLLCSGNETDEIHKIWAIKQVMPSNTAEVRGPVICLPCIVAKYREKTDDVKMEEFIKNLGFFSPDYGALDERPPAKPDYREWQR